MWIDKPDADGLWWFQSERGHQSLWLVIDSKCQVVRDAHSNWIHDTGTPTVIPNYGKWQRCELTPPAPYVAPKPPKVEQYTAKHCGEFRFLSRIGDYCLATDADCKRSGTWIGWNVVQAQYTDIQPCDQANT